MPGNCPEALAAVIIATIVPLALFYGLSAASGMKAGIIASLAWAYLVLGRQLLALGASRASS